jgi:hypothetical protein
MLDLGFHGKQLSLQSLRLLLLLDLEQESTVDVWQHTTERDGGADESVKLLVATNGELKVARRNTLHLEILGSIACELEDLSGQVLENGGDIDGSLGTNTHLVLGVLLEETLDTTAGKLETSASRVALLLLSTIGTRLSTGALAARGLSLAARHLC